MSQRPNTIVQHPALKSGEDFFLLRREGIDWISKLGSSIWTDYNTHDPGITILEALCYAITDLTYRAGWEIKDILSAQKIDEKNPFPNQVFFRAKEIFTVNPWTSVDFRRLLIDLDLVRNAWVFCRECACDQMYYAWCEQNQLMLSYKKPADESLSLISVGLHGMYDVLLELEEDPELGDLNDKKIVQTFKIGSEGNPCTIEVRFPAWDLVDATTYDAFVSSTTDPLMITVGKFSNDKTAVGIITDSDLHEHWREIFYISFTFIAGGKEVTINNATVRIICDGATMRQLKVDAPGDMQNSLLSKLKEGSSKGFVQLYRRKLQKQTDQVEIAMSELNRHRNLDEDFCRVNIIEVEDIAVCADVEVTPDADIERVHAKIWFAIEQYFNPPVPFYTLNELLDEGIAVEEIFNGPVLKNGFIKAKELEAAGLKSELRVSDIVNLLMDIDGVVAVNNMIMTKYDVDGNVAAGDADPSWNNGVPTYVVNKTSASWLLRVSPFHQPRPYHDMSSFLFLKNGLPFLPRMDEVYDTLTQLRGEAERPKIKSVLNDLPVPSGIFRDPGQYLPVQYSFPLNYSIGSAGLPSTAQTLRRAQAMQLKAYLMVFEQLLGNAFAQLAHTADLFSLDHSVLSTYFTHLFSETEIQGYDGLNNGLNQSKLDSIIESLPEYQDRRNRFLDHLLARFGEEFSEYALMLTNWKGQQVALDRLIDDKISFLKSYPVISSDRGKAFNYMEKPCSPENISIIKKRVSLLLGYPDLNFVWTMVEPVLGVYSLHFTLEDTTNGVWLAGDLKVPAATPADAQLQAFRMVIARMAQPDAYETTPENSLFRLRLLDRANTLLGQCPVLFETIGDAQEYRNELLAWSSNERVIVVEHLLLRPKFPGDAIYPACSDGSCMTCGDEDPYSFRLTFVMPGWASPFSENLDMRDFADRTICKEVPSHLLPKICWIGNDGYVENLCDGIIEQVAELLATQDDLCDVSKAIYTAFSESFSKWYEDKRLVNSYAKRLKMNLKNRFKMDVKCESFNVAGGIKPGTWNVIRKIMLEHFINIALSGFQFDRFEDAWYKWLQVNSTIDWKEERLQERVLALLGSDPESSQRSKVDLCECATRILGEYGTRYSTWVISKVQEGSTPDSLTDFPEPAVSCANFAFSSNTRTAIETLLRERYTAYAEVSYRLRIVVDLLGELQNVYPGATLHDCDDGSDVNPVRLGRTALGRNPIRQNGIKETDAPKSSAASDIAGTGVLPLRSSATKTMKTRKPLRVKKLKSSNKAKKLKRLRKRK